MINGILLIDKPTGWTSHDVVAKVRALLKPVTGQAVKVGHTGTLDPMATGLLILVVGSYTKRASQFSQLDKTYEAEITLGSTSDTGDAEGKITPVNQTKPGLSEVKTVIESFLGESRQVPPAYSAIKVKGQEAYKIARSGRALQLEPRLVIIYKFEKLNYSYPKLRFEVSVSSGTYIRSLAQDIGAKLGTGAYLSKLRRLSVGQFDIEDAITINQVRAELVKTL